MGKRKNQGVIKKMLKDHFDGFWRLHERRFPKSHRADVKETEEKAIKCGSRDIGYARYECLGCEGKPTPVFIGFTCKSRFCHRCGKKYTDDWAKKQEEMIFNVPHRHMVFTVPKEIRSVFFQDFKKLNEISEEVADVFRYYFHHRSKKREFKVGVITVIHTFGRDLKFHPHIHVLVTEGAMDYQKEWVPVEYISYEFLRKSWQKLLMDKMLEWFPHHPKVRKMVDDL
ncbi:transposase zinc-binding domain-containing protein, partial [Alteribacillus sp. JSM 102045]|uniref:IS91 family transposase n=1 Tax=Alteribacillus sp. JSM 102045 TaxID=1562101 RepID=UPI0035BF9333